ACSAVAEAGTVLPQSPERQCRSSETLKTGATHLPAALALTPSRLSHLPRPPPLTLPADIKAASTGSGISPLLFSMLTPHLLDGLLTGRLCGTASPGTLMAAAGLHTSTGREGTAGLHGQQRGGSGGLCSPVPPPLSPQFLWPDTSKPVSSCRAITLSDLLGQMEDAEAGVVLGEVANSILRGSGAQPAVGAGVEQQGGQGPGWGQGAPAGEVTGVVYKGIHYNKARNRYQVFLYDGSGLCSVADYLREEEAQLVFEVLTPTPLPPSELQRVLGPLNQALTPAAVPGSADSWTALDCPGPGRTPTHLISTSLLLSPGTTLPDDMGHLGSAAYPQRSQLAQQQQPPVGGEGGHSRAFRGVRYDQEQRAWQAYVVEGPGGAPQWLPGKYTSEEAAARAHDVEVLRRFGATSDLNFPPWAVDRGSEGCEQAGGQAGGQGRSASSGGQGQGGRRVSSGSRLAEARGAELVAGAAEGRGQRGAPLPSASLDSSIQSQGPSGELAAAGPGGRKRGRGGSSAQVERDTDSLGEVQAPKSKYRGVVWDYDTLKWRAQLASLGRVQDLGLFASQDEAARCYDQAVVRGGLSLRTNFPPSYYKDGAVPDSKMVIGRGSHKSGSGTRVTSQYKGVSWNSACSKWVAVLWDRELKRARHIGSFESEEAAARAYDREAIKMLGADAGLNFRESMTEYLASTGLTVAASEPSSRDAAKGSSQYRGVSWHDRSQRWEVRVWGGGKQHFIGSYGSEVEAARAYDKAVLQLRGADARSRSRMNFPLSDYNLEELATEPLACLAGVAPEPSAGAPTRSGSPPRNTHRRPSNKRSRQPDTDPEEDTADEQGSGPGHEQLDAGQLQLSASVAAALATIAGQGLQDAPALSAQQLQQLMGMGLGTNPLMALPGLPAMFLNTAPEMQALMSGTVGQLGQLPPMNFSLPMDQAGWPEEDEGQGKAGKARGHKRRGSVGAAREGAGGEQQGVGGGGQRGKGPHGLTAPAVVPPGGKGRSMYRGVSWCEKVKKWRALLWDGVKQRFLGHYPTDLEAALAHDRAVIELKGPEAKTNFPAGQLTQEAAVDRGIRQQSGCTTSCTKQRSSSSGTSLE
ncbi:hypothetical protein QJQ45_020050, partial [Haematococcus lacustris]